MIAVIMCGGVGSRMRPITELLPKPLLKIGNRPILDILICQLIEAGIENIYLTLGYKAEMIISYVEKQNYAVNIEFVTEETPLGTAGGLKNAVNETLDDIIVLSGDNVFTFDLKLIYSLHINASADVSIVGAYRDDPRNYGTMLLNNDDTIQAFVEKPSWSQVESNIINTGIYIISGDILALIPHGEVYDFAKDLFPLLMRQNYKLCSFLPDGVWADLGDMESYMQANRFAMEGKYGNILHEDSIVKKDLLLENGTLIKAPCVIAGNVEIKDNCKIGPYTVIGEGCTIDSGCLIENSIISDACQIGRNFYCSDSYIGTHCTFSPCVTIESDVIISGYTAVSKFVKIAAGSHVALGCNIADDITPVNGNISNADRSSLLSAHGIHETSFDSFSLIDAMLAGYAVGQCKNNNRVGIGHDGKRESRLYVQAFILGMQIAGVTVYDFAEMFRSQRVFYSQYCSLDFFLFAETNEHMLSASFSGVSGAPIDRNTERDLIAAFRYNTTLFMNENVSKDVFFMQPIASVYNSVFLHSVPQSLQLFNVAVACDNRKIYELVSKTLREKDYCYDYGGILFIIDKYGEKFFCIENEHAFSHDRILSICCNYAFANGDDVVVNESAPGIIETLADSYGQQVYRLYEAGEKPQSDVMSVLANQTWAFDGIACIAQLMKIMQDTNKTIRELSDGIPECFMKNFTLSYEGDAQNFRSILKNKGALRSQTRDGYYEWEDERGIIRVKSDTFCKNIRVLIEAESIEMSRELSADAQEKIKNCAIDKFLQS